MHPDNHAIRLHRANSWLARALATDESDLDARFIFLWIALNSAYAREFSNAQSERDKLLGFIADLLAVDTDKTLHGLVMQRFSGPVRTLIDNPYVFQPFWQALREHDSSGRWEQQFAGAKKKAMAALLEGRTDMLYSIIVDRLYVLRNQLVHGGATCGSKVNRSQLRDACQLLEAVVPVVIALMAAHPERDWGEIMYPVVGGV